MGHQCKTKGEMKVEEQLQKSLASILNKVTQGVEAGANFLAAELPDVVHQLLLWKLWEAVITLVFSVLLVALFLTLAYRSFKYATLANRATDDKAIATSGVEKVRFATQESENVLKATVCGGISVLLGMFSVLGAVPAAYLKIQTIVQILVAPKIYLIEYAASLAK